MAQTQTLIGSKHLLSFAFDLAIQGVIQNGLSGSIEEETTTGALLGAMAAHAPWAYVLGQADPDLVPYSWTHYSKGGSNPNSESWVGADFALIVRNDDTHFRAAVFQAKRSTTIKGSFDTLQIAPAIRAHPPEPQVLRLYRYGEKSQQATGSGMHWLHYLIYKEISISCISLMDSASGLTAHIDKIRNVTPNPLSVSKAYHSLSQEHMTKLDVARLYKAIPAMFTPSAQPLDWITMLKLGIESPAGKSVTGWLSLHGVDAAKSFIEATSAYLSVYEGSPSQYEPVFKTHQSIKVNQTIGDKIHRSLLMQPDLNMRLGSTFLSKGQ